MRHASCVPGHRSQVTGHRSRVMTLLLIFIWCHHPIRPDQSCKNTTSAYACVRVCTRIPTSQVQTAEHACAQYLRHEQAAHTCDSPFNATRYFPLQKGFTFHQHHYGTTPDRHSNNSQLITVQPPANPSGLLGERIFLLPSDVCSLLAVIRPTVEDHIKVNAMQ